MSKSSITFEENKWLFENGLTIRAYWISPDEGWEYSLVAVGQVTRSLSSGYGTSECIRKSPRACFNFAKRRLTQRAPDSLKAAEISQPDTNQSESNKPAVSG